MKKGVVFEIIRWLAVIILVAALASFSDTDKISNADFDKVCSSVVNEVDLSYMQEGSASTFKRLYSLDSSDYEEVKLYWPLSNMDADEILIIKLRDVSQQEEIKQAVENRLETQKKSFDGYGVEQYALLTDNSILDIQGNYILFIVSKDCVSAEKAFRNAL